MRPITGGDMWETPFEFVSSPKWANHMQKEEEDDLKKRKLFVICRECCGKEKVETRHFENI